MSKDIKKRVIRPAAFMLAVLLLAGSLSGCRAAEQEPAGESLAAQQSGQDEAAVTAETTPTEAAPTAAAQDYDTTVFQERYYYQTLNEEEQRLYAQLYHKVDELAEEIAFTEEVDAISFHKSIYALTQDCPEFFWLGTNLKIITIERTGNVTAVGVSFDQVGQEEVRQQRDAIEQITDQWIAEIDPGGGTYDKIKRVFEMIVERTSYVEGAMYNQDIRSVFLNNQSVCAGYARAMQYLLLKMDIFCTLVNGQMIDGTGHSWNLVELDGAYYWVDVTQGDSSSDGLSIYYAYLCFDDTVLNRNYRIDKTVGLSTMPDQESEFFQYPACDSSAYSYYQMLEQSYDSFDMQGLREQIYQRAAAGERSFSFQYTNEEAFNQAVQALEDQTLLEQVLLDLMQEQGISNWNYKYSSDTRVYTIYIML